MNRVLGVFCLCSFTSTCAAQNLSDTTSAAFARLTEWLPGKSYHFQLTNLPGTGQSRIIPVDSSDGLSAAAFKNYMDSSYQAASCATPYDARMGITSADYENLKHLDKRTLKKNLTIEGTVLVDQSAGLIRFRTTHGYPYLDSFSIDLINKQLIYGRDSLQHVFAFAGPGKGPLDFVNVNWMHKVYYQSHASGIRQDRSRGIHIMISRDVKQNTIIFVQRDDQPDGVYLSQNLTLWIIELSPSLR